MTLNTKHTQTLEKIYERPTRANIAWTDIVGLFKACGADVSQRQGSHVCIKLGQQRTVFHAPHPQKETVKGAVEDVRAFLQRAEVTP